MSYLSISKLLKLRVVLESLKFLISVGSESGHGELVLEAKVVVGTPQICIYYLLFCPQHSEGVLGRVFE